MKAKGKRLTPPADAEKAERCNQCGQKLIEIDNRGKRLVGCLTCNLWTAADSKRWIRLNEEDLRARGLDAYRAPSGAGQPSYGQANVVCTLCHCAKRETGCECQY